MKETTRHIILAAKNRYEKQGGIKAVVSKITGVEEKYLDKRAITHWYRDACNDMDISKDKIIDSIIKKTQSFREYEDNQDIIIEALRLQLTFLDVLDEYDNVIVELGEPDLFGLKVLRIDEQGTLAMYDSDSFKEGQFRVSLKISDNNRKLCRRDHDETTADPSLDIILDTENYKITSISGWNSDAEESFGINLSKKEKEMVLNHIRNHITSIKKLFQPYPAIFPDIDITIIDEIIENLKEQ